MKVLRYWGLGILVVLIFVLAAQARYQILGPTIARSFPESYELLKVLSAVSFSLTFCHFFLDEMMFKMKNPQVRQQIAKLLSEEPV